MGRAPRVLTARDVVGMLDGQRGAYVHVPFCTRICPFCPYNKVVPRQGQPTAYFEALSREVDAHVEAGAAGSGGFTSLYVGGGTPTLFHRELAALLSRIPVAGERAIEVLPTHATPSGLDALRAMGFTAVSIGAQSFHDEVLSSLRRPHDAGTARAAVSAAVGRFALVDVDLIVDVELDDHLAGAFLRDLTDCFELDVDQVSTYPLMRFGYTPFGSTRHDRRREHEILAEATRIAVDHGYERRSVWTFNRRDCATYTSITRRRFLGMGAGASSFLGQDFLVNHFGVRAYIDAVGRGRLPVARWLHLGPLGGTAYDAFWQAYTGRITPQALAAGHPGRIRSLDLALAPLVGAGLVHRIGTGPTASFALTPRGYDRYHDLERAVTYRLIEPLWGQMLEEHGGYGAAAWATPERRRAGVAWALASRAFERPLAA